MKMIRSSASKLPVKAGGLLVGMIAFSLCACAKPDQLSDRLGGNNADTLQVSVQADQTFQQIDNFGASDAWTCQYVGLWNASVKDKIADLLFSQEVDEQGNPIGIGLSAWRFNIGAGSAEQEDKSGIKDPWRRSESFLQSGGQYDFDRAAGQRWFLAAAKKRGVQDFIGFCNSAPYMMTNNGLTYSTGGKTNLAPDKYAAFADYLVKVIKGLKEKTGVLLNYISPVNEPQWDWSDGGQEGSPYRNTEIADLIRVLNRGLEAAALQTKISIAEAGQIDYLYDGGNKPKRGTQIQEFLMPGSSSYLLNLGQLSHKIAAHSYFTTSPYVAAIAAREKLHAQIAAARAASGIKDLGYWMSEYCILGDNHGEIDGNHRDLGMNSALYIAKVIHMDLCYAGASGWHWWLALSAYDYKDGLIYVDKTSTTGNYYPSKMLWALGNYSRFIRPGFVRMGSLVAGETHKDSSLLVSAFKDPKSAKAVLVMVNLASTGKEINMNTNNLVVQDAYITSDKYNLGHFKIKDPAHITLPAASVTTLIGTLK